MRIYQLLRRPDGEQDAHPLQLWSDFRQGDYLRVVQVLEQLGEDCSTHREILIIHAKPEAKRTAVEKRRYKNSWHLCLGSLSARVTYHTEKMKRYDK